MTAKSSMKVFKIVTIAKKLKIGATELLNEYNYKNFKNL